MLQLRKVYVFLDGLVFGTQLRKAALRVNGVVEQSGKEALGQGRWGYDQIVRADVPTNGSRTTHERAPP
jgi:hypothetical protein